MKYYGVSAIALMVGLGACAKNPNPTAILNTPMIKYKTEKVKYPDRYMQKLFENGVKEVYVTTTKRFTPND